MHWRRARWLPRLGARLPAIEIDELAKLVTSATFIDALRAGACPIVPDAYEVMELKARDDVYDNLFVSAETTGCNEGPVAEVRTALRKLLDRSSTDGGAD